MSDTLFEDISLHGFQDCDDFSNIDILLPLQVVQIYVFLLFLKTIDSFDKFFDGAALLWLRCLPCGEVDW